MWGHEGVVDDIVVEARLGNVEAPRVDVVQVVRVLLVRPDKFSRVILSEHKLARTSRRACVGALDDGLCRLVIRLRQDIDIFQSFEAALL